MNNKESLNDANPINENQNDSLSDSVKASIKNIIMNENLIEYEIEEKRIDSDGENFLGIITEVNIKGKTKYGSKEMYIFVKEILYDSLIEYLSTVEVFKREAFVYNELLPVYEILQENANIPSENRFIAPKSYTGTSANAIILENLSKNGFTTLDRQKLIQITFAELSVKELAKFHALSLVLQKQKPDYFDENIKEIQTTFKGEMFIDFYKKKGMKLLHRLGNNYQGLLLKVLDNCETRFNKHWDMKNFCICHGDYRANNILYRETEGVIQQVIPVDFQLFYYGNPLTDFMYFIYIGTDRDFRRRHMEDLKNLYYDTLKQFLKYFNINLDDYFCREEFEVLFQDCLEYGLLLSILVVPFLYIDVQDNGFKVDEEFKTRIEGIFDDFIEMGYF